MNVLITKHKLDFEVRVAEEYRNLSDAGWLGYRVGTCNGLWRSTESDYEILVIRNDNKGNGHLEDVFQWFEYSCKRDQKDLLIMDVLNKQFKDYLINKRGFVDVGSDNVRKKMYLLKYRK